MKKCFEGWRIYQTLAEPSTAYPTLPTFTATAPGSSVYTSSDIANTQSVWYVKELTDVKWDTTGDVPEITATDTGKRFYAFNMGNGPVVGRFAQTRGMARTYYREGTYLAGFWQNGQLFVVPLMEGFGCNRCNALRKQKGLEWQVTVPAVDDYWIKMSEQTHTLTDDLDPIWVYGITSPDGSSYTDAQGTTDSTGTTGYESCRAGKLYNDTAFLGIGDDALYDYENSPYYGNPGTIFEYPWDDSKDRLAVLLRHKGVNRQILLQASIYAGSYYYASYVFTALYEKENKKCFPSSETYTRTSITVSEYAGGQVTLIPPSVTDVRTNYEDQLPTSVTVAQV